MTPEEKQKIIDGAVVKKTEVVRVIGKFLFGEGYPSTLFQHIRTIVYAMPEEREDVVWLYDRESDNQIAKRKFIDEVMKPLSQASGLLPAHLRAWAESPDVKKYKSSTTMLGAFLLAVADWLDQGGE